MSLVTIQNNEITAQIIETDKVFKFDFGKLLKRMSDDEFLEFSRRNEGWRVEMKANGDLDIMPGTGFLTGKRNSRITRRLDEWAEADGNGVAINSDAVFNLPNGARRMADAAWISNEKVGLIKNQNKPLPFAPDFVIELSSPSDSVAVLKDKMREYIENGVSLGWLIDPKNKRVYVYRPNAETEILDNPHEISGEPLLKNFVLDLTEIWS